MGGGDGRAPVSLLFRGSPLFYPFFFFSFSGYSVPDWKLLSDTTAHMHKSVHIFPLGCKV